MTGDLWQSILARAAAAAPLPLDPAEAPSPPPAVARRPGSAAGTPPAALFPPAEGDIAFVGIRVRRRPADPAALATRLAAIAAERGTWGIILSEIGATGLERFGLRVEHLPPPGDDPDGLALRELEAFWNLAIVVDAEDIAGFS
ncbi:MAG: hypothetical protein N2422_06585 [Rhodobacteraceae bacterium]|nr:hypothetical protein [Paracoccaceae bacterium]